MGPILAIETSGDRGGVALLEEDGGILELDLEEGSTHGRTLVPAIRELLKRAGLSPRELRAVAVSAGPGSYTGLRIGLTAAKTLAWAAGLGAVRVSTLEALALDAAGAEGVSAARLVPAIDARRGEVYWACFALEGGRIRRESPDQATTPEKLSRNLRPGDFVFGTAVRTHRDAFARSGSTLAPGPECPRAATVARLGAELLAAGVCASAHDLAPEYLRQPEAVLKKERTVPLV